MSSAIREIFIEELEDVVDEIEASLTRLFRDPSVADAESLVIRRGFHTLKGAAHAAGEPGIEATCEHAETTIASQIDDIEVVTRTAREYVPLLRAQLVRLRGPQALSNRPGNPPPPTQPPRPSAPAGSIPPPWASIVSSPPTIAPRASAPPPSPSSPPLRPSDLLLGSSQPIEASEQPSSDAPASDAPAYATDRSSEWTALPETAGDRRSSPPVTTRAASPPSSPPPAPEPPRSPFESANESGNRPSNEATVRVNAERVDTVVNAAEDLITLLGQSSSLDVLDALFHSVEHAQFQVGALARVSESNGKASSAERRAATRGALAAIREMQALTVNALQTVRARDSHVQRAAQQLGNELRGLRIAPVAPLIAAVRQTVDETAATLGRDVMLHSTGRELEIDRQLRDQLRDPLLHLVRNAIDHGIEPSEERARLGKPEQGQLRLDLAIVGSELRVSLGDDGRGIDRGAVRARAESLGWRTDGVDTLALIFEPGMSTKKETSSISGRGIGLDVVRESVARLHGRIETESVRGRGTVFSLRLPLSHGALRVVRARCHTVDALFPAISVERVRRIGESDTTLIEDRMHLLVPNEAPIPMARLDSTWQLERVSAPADFALGWLIIATGGRKIAVGVDHVASIDDAVVQGLDGRLDRIPAVSGTTILAEGRVGLVVDVDEVARIAAPLSMQKSSGPAAVRTILVVDDSVTTRALQRSLLEAVGYHVVIAANGREALDRLGETRVHAVISDVEMPILDGFELLERVRSLPWLRDTPIILVTARDRDADRRRALELGANAYVLKSEFDRQTILDLLEDLLND